MYRSQESFQHNDTEPELSPGFAARAVPGGLLGCLLAAAWIGLNVYPLLDPTHLDPLAWQRSHSLTTHRLAQSIAHHVLLLLSESLVFLLVFGIVKAIGSRPLRLVSAALALLSVSLYMLLIGASWNCFAVRGMFFHGYDAALFDHLLDVRAIFLLISQEDMYKGALMLSISSALAGMFFVAAAPLPSVRGLLSWLIVPAGALLLNIALARMEIGGMTKHEKSDMRFLLANFVSPQGAFFCGMLFGECGESVPEIELRLEPRYGLEEYRKRIPAGWTPPKNVIVFMIEALRSDTLASQGGDPRILPNINELAASGVSFRNAYAQAPETCYSISTMVSGLYPLKFPTRDINLDLDYPLTRIYDLLDELGVETSYFTAASWSVMKRIVWSQRLDPYYDAFIDLLGSKLGMSSIIFGESARGLDRWNFDSVDISKIDRMAIDRMKREIAAHAGRNQRFFSMVYLYASHFPYDPVPGAEEIFAPNALERTPSFFAYPKEIAPVMRNRYWNALRYLDSLVGEIREELEKTGLAEDTVVIVTGDHGEAFHEHDLVAHSVNLYDPVIKVPFVVGGANDLRPRAELSEPIGHVDLAPTILEIYGLPPHGNYQGLSALTRGATQPAASEGARPIFSTLQMLSYEDAVVAYPYKLMKNRRDGTIRLFDLSADPKEDRNLAGSQIALSERLLESLDRFRAQQLSYYALPRAERNEYFPPAPPDYVETGRAIKVEDGRLGEPLGEKPSDDRQPL